MYIQDSLLDLLISQLTIEYNGTHNADSKNPLWGRHAYWRVYLNGSFVAKITTRVHSINPRPETLKKLFKAELKKRIGAISETVEADHYTQVYILQRDPYGVRRLVEHLKGQFYDLRKVG